MNDRLRIGSVFSGIGGLELGLEAAGLGRTLWQVEIEDFQRRVLAKNFPHAERFVDIHDVGRTNLAPVDILVGGFPCQGFSRSGKRLGFCDPRSALWSEQLRIISELKPSAVVVENVVDMAEERHKGDVRVVNDLRALGYVVDKPLVINAAAIGASHARKRLFVLAVRPGRLTKADLGPEPAAFEVESPALRGRPQKPGEAPRTLVSAPRYPGLDKAKRINALGNAVMPLMAYVVGLRLRDLISPAGRLTKSEREALGWDVAHPSEESPRGKVKFWPTVLANDGKGSRKDTARKKHWESNPGTMLTDAVWQNDQGDWGRPLNPVWVEQLMTFPVDFTRLTGESGQD